MVTRKMAHPGMSNSHRSNCAVSTDRDVTVKANDGDDQCAQKRDDQCGPDRGDWGLKR